MTDRNPSQSFRPRDSERYAELSDLLGDIGADVPIAPHGQGFDLPERQSLESVLANVDANYPLRPREVSLGGLTSPRGWNAHESAFSRATPVTAPLEPRTLDAWDLRPALEPAGDIETNFVAVEALVDDEVLVDDEALVDAEALVDSEAIEEMSASVPVVEAISDDEDAFLSVLDGLEDDILGDAEISDFSEPDIIEAEMPAQFEVFGANAAEVQVADVQVAEVQVADIQVAAASQPDTNLDIVFDDSIFEDMAETTPEAVVSDTPPSSDILFEEPVFEDIDFDLPVDLPVGLQESLPVDLQTDLRVDAGAATEREDVSETFTMFRDTLAATALASGATATILGSMRANASRETHTLSGELPVMALPVAHKPAANAEPMFPHITAPYDDVPVTGSLKVPDFVATEANVRQPSPGFDDFEMSDFQPTQTSLPAEVTFSNTINQPDTIVHEQVRNTARGPVADQVMVEALDDLDFGNAFDNDFSPTDELADLVGSNVTPDPLMPTAKDDDFTPMPAIPSIIAARHGRGKWMAVGALGLAIAGALAIYGSSGDNVDASIEPAIVRADNEPVRVAPENPGGTVVPNQDRVVFNQVGGNSAVPEQPQETLVDSRQEPAIAAVPLKEDDRVLDGDNSAELSAPEGTAVAPRSVQTVTVRPDGTLVANAPAAEAAAAPQAEVVPETRPENEPQTQLDTAVAQPLPEPTNPIAEIAAASVPQIAVAETPTLEPAVSQVPVGEIPVAEETVAAKVPTKVVEIKPVVQKPKIKVANTEAKALEAVPSRPSDQPVKILNADAPAVPEQPAEQKTVAVEPASTQADALAAGTYAIQIASQPTEEAATSSLRSLSGKFGSILGGKDYAIQRAEVPGKGTFYRVRILAGSKADAGKLCARYKSAGGSCFVTR